MKLFLKSLHTGADYYTRHEGMSLETVTALLTEMGCTGIQQITEEDWNLAQEGN